MVGVDPGFPELGAKAIWDVVPTALLGGEVFGRRSGRSDWMAGEVKGGEGKEESCCEKEPRTRWHMPEIGSQHRVFNCLSALCRSPPSLLTLTAVSFHLFFGLGADLVLQ